jgi:hypothetical protein
MTSIPILVCSNILERAIDGSMDEVRSNPEMKLTLMIMKTIFRNALREYIESSGASELIEKWKLQDERYCNFLNIVKSKGISAGPDQFIRDTDGFEEGVRLAERYVAARLMDSKYRSCIDKWKFIDEAIDHITGSDDERRR